MGLSIMSGSELDELRFLLSTISEENAIRLMKRYNKIMRWVIADFRSSRPISTLTRSA
jgi:hypothetical protein